MGPLPKPNSSNSARTERIYHILSGYWESDPASHAPHACVLPIHYTPQLPNTSNGIIYACQRQGMAFVTLWKSSDKPLVYEEKVKLIVRLPIYYISVSAQHVSGLGR